MFAKGLFILHIFYSFPVNQSFKRSQYRTCVIKVQRDARFVSDIKSFHSEHLVILVSFSNLLESALAACTELYSASLHCIAFKQWSGRHTKARRAKLALLLLEGPDIGASKQTSSYIGCLGDSSITWRCSRPQFSVQISEQSLVVLPLGVLDFVSNHSVGLLE